MAIFSPTSRLSSVDFPTFGAPMIETNPDLNDGSVTSHLAFIIRHRPDGWVLSPLHFPCLGHKALLCHMASPSLGYAVIRSLGRRSK